MIIENIYKFIDFKGITAYEISKRLGISNGYLVKTRQNKGNVGGHILEKIVRYYPDINSRWLLTGKGEMIKNNQNSLNQSIVGNENYMAGKDIVIDKENKALIEEIKALRAQIIEKDLIIKTLVEQQKKLINKL